MTHCGITINLMDCYMLEKVLYLYKGEMPENTKITLKNDTSGIADNAFSYCTNLTNIKIPDSVTIIGAWAFLVVQILQL